MFTPQSICESICVRDSICPLETRQTPSSCVAYQAHGQTYSTSPHYRRRRLSATKCKGVVKRARGGGERAKTTTVRAAHSSGHHQRLARSDLTGLPVPTAVLRIVYPPLCVIRDDKHPPTAIALLFEKIPLDNSQSRGEEDVREG